jgi:DNA topoisomerase-1
MKSFLISKRADTIKLEPKWEKHRDLLWFLPSQKNPPVGFESSEWVRPVPVETPNIPIKYEESNIIREMLKKLGWDDILLNYNNIKTYLPLDSINTLNYLKSKMSEKDKLVVDNILERVKEQRGTKEYKYDTIDHEAKDQMPYLQLGEDIEKIGERLSYIAEILNWPNPVESWFDNNNNEKFRLPGYIKDNRGRVVRMSKLLEQAKRKMKNDTVILGDGRDLSMENFAKYVNDKYSVAPKLNKWKLVVSAEPSDILMMSTNKGWTSCMGEGKSNYSSLDSATTNRDMVAYAVAPNHDKWVSRVWLRFDGKGHWWPETKIYGTTSLDNKIFLEAVNKYLSKYGILGKVGEYSPEAKGWSDFAKSKIEFSDKVLKPSIEEIKERQIQNLPYEDIKPEIRKYKIFVKPYMDSLVKKKLEAFSKDIINITIDRDDGDDALFANMPAELVKELYEIPEIIKIIPAGTYKILHLIVKDKSFNENVLNKLTTFCYLSSNHDIPNIKEIVSEINKDYTKFLYFFPKEKKLYDTIISENLEILKLQILGRYWGVFNKFKLIGPGIIDIELLAENATKILSRLKKMNITVKIKNSFYISKRANYIEKRKEESGNITYIYDEKHIKARNKKKAARLLRLSKSLKNMRAQVKKDITNEDDRTRLAAIAVALIDETFERVGNRYSAADMKHYGVTTWLVKHIKFSGSTARIKYIGKSGVKQNKFVSTPKVVSALKKLCSAKKPGDLVFEMEDFTLTDNNVNQYLRPFNITAKDIRGLHANVEVRKQLQKMKKDKDQKERKENFKKAVEVAAKIVGHKPSTLKNQYLIPGFEEKYITKGELIGPKTATRIPLIIKQAEHTGAMLAIMAPKGIIKRIDDKIDEDCKSVLHLTLLYLGDSSKLNESELNAIEKVVQKVCEKHNPLKMEISGAGVFTPGDKGTPTFIIPNAKGLSALQAELEEAVSNIVDLPSDHGWVPHMTLSYSEEPELPEIIKYKWTANKVRFQVGGKKHADIPLGKKADFLISKRALIKQEYEEQLEKEYDGIEIKEQGKYDSLTEEEKKAEEEFLNYNKKLEIQNRPKRKRSKITADKMLAEMYPEKQEYLNRYFEAQLFRHASHFNWTKPLLKDELPELLRVALEEGMSYDSLKRSFNHGILRSLDKKIWEHLDNTDSLPIKSLDDAIALAENYGKNWQPIQQAFEEQKSLPAPTVLERTDGSITLVGGNTRLAFAKAHHVKPEVYWIKELELFETPHRIEPKL